MKWTISLMLGACPLFAQPVEPSIYLDLSGEWELRSEGRQPERVVLPNSQQMVRETAYTLHRTVELPANLPVGELALAAGSVPGSYRVYLNGVDVGGQEVSPYRYWSLPEALAVPPGVFGSGRKVDISIRVIPSQQRGNPRFLAVDQGPWVIGPAWAARQMAEGSLARRRAERTPLVLILLAQIILTVLLAAVWAENRDRRDFFWMAMLGLESVVENGCNVLGLVNPVASMSFVAEATLALFGIHPGRWRVLVWLPSVPLVLSFFGGSFRTHSLASDLPLAALGIVMISLCAHRLIRRPRQRIVAAVMACYWVLWLNAIPTVAFFPLLERMVGNWRWPVVRVAQALLGGGLAVYVIRGLLASQRERARLAGELDTARSLQRMLVPGEPASVGGYSIDTAYEPAAEVGGDFCIVLPWTDGSVLVVLGDVSGKGLKAAMAATMMTGIARSFQGSPPGRFLAEANLAFARGLAGFITCAAVRLWPGGEFRLASAGHLAPYHSGSELEVAGGLPLGMTPDSEYAEVAGRLAPGESLTLVTDGVVEAANGGGELFGFERTRAISTRSAQEIAGAAQAWGQNDDITVVTVRRCE